MTCLSFVANPILVGGGNAFVKRLETFFGKFEFNPYLKETKLGVARALFEPWKIPTKMTLKDTDNYK